MLCCISHSIWLVFAWMSWPVAIGGVSAAQVNIVLLQITLHKLK